MQVLGGKDLRGYCLLLLTAQALFLRSSSGAYGGKQNLSLPTVLKGKCFVRQGQAPAEISLSSNMSLAKL
jgi:hypothetical protein